MMMKKKKNSCIPDEKIQVNPRFWPGLKIYFSDPGVLTLLF